MLQPERLIRRVIHTLEDAGIEYMVTGSVVSSPEDTILAKLKWAQLSGGSEKQFADALRVHEIQYGKLDLDYLVDWAEALNVESALKRLQDTAQVL